MSANLDLLANDADVISSVRNALKGLEGLPLPLLVDAINQIRLELHCYSPFKQEPVDCVQWINADLVTANDYNPNSVAPPEMKLLEHSIQSDGYTQPIVSFANAGGYEVVDGFHRHRVGKESKIVAGRIKGYLPLVVINSEREDRSDRIAATIRHNRARGKHSVEAMSDIVVELKRRNWSDERIANELGMEPDEVLRLCQITGLAEVFADTNFTQAWEVNTNAPAEVFSDVIADFVPNDKGRVFHTYEKWECYRHNFYGEHPPEGGEELYREFLSNIPRFEAAMEVIVTTWTHSCEHYLTNDRMNRIAWLGQAAAAQAMQVPAVCRGGFGLLTQAQQWEADQAALKYLNRWLVANGREPVAMQQAYGRTEAELY